MNISTANLIQPAKHDNIKYNLFKFEKDKKENVSILCSTFLEKSHLVVYGFWQQKLKNEQVKIMFVDIQTGHVVGMIFFILKIVNLNNTKRCDLQFQRCKFN